MENPAIGAELRANNCSVLYISKGNLTLDRYKSNMSSLYQMCDMTRIET